MVRAQFERRLARPVDQPDRARFTGAGRAAQCDGVRRGPGAPETGARPHHECRTVRSRPGARHSRTRYAAAEGHHHDHRQTGGCGNPGHRSCRASAERRRHRVQIVVRAGPCLACPARSRSHRRSRRRPGAIRRQRDRRVGGAGTAQGKALWRGTCGRSRRLRRTMGTGAQGQRLPESSSARISDRCSISSRATRWRRTSPCRRACNSPATG